MLDVHVNRLRKVHRSFTVDDGSPQDRGPDEEFQGTGVIRKFTNAETFEAVMEEIGEEQRE